MSRLVHTAAVQAAPTNRSAYAPSIVFSYSGPVTSLVTSPPVLPRRTMIFTGLSVAVGTPGTSGVGGPTIITLVVNGNPSGDELSIPAGASNAYVAFTNPVTVRGLQDTYQLTISPGGYSTISDVGGEIWVS